MCENNMHVDGETKQFFQIFTVLKEIEQVSCIKFLPRNNEMDYIYRVCH